VTAIVGIRNVWLEFGGQAGHSGTTPMDRRADALWGASAFVSQARELVVSRFSPGGMNCGYLYLEPGSFNVIPAEVRLGLEIRHGSEAELDRMETALLALAAEVAQAYGLRLSIEPVPGACVATPMDARLLHLVEQAAADLGLDHTRLLSLAGHDAQNLAPFVPTALFFVPSVAGISHQPAEFTRPEDVANGANLLLHTLLRLGRVEG
jgi:N-carbamoyl-L-amino-acid hydrolase